MRWKILAAAMGAAVAMGMGAPAMATVQFCTGGGCAAQPEFNVALDKGMSGTTVTGKINDTAGGEVTFTSPQDMYNDANGSANLIHLGSTKDAPIALADPITITYAGGLITALELQFDLIKPAAGAINFLFAGGDSEGITYTWIADATSEYMNFFGGSFTGITITFEGGAQVFDIAQVRISRTDSTQPPVSAVPEPAIWAMLVAGFGMVGVALRRRPAVRPRLA